MANRTRKKSISIRLTEKELSEVKRKAKEFGMTQSEFLMMCVTNKKIINIYDARLLDIDCKRIGTNLNQMARRINRNMRINYKLFNQNQNRLAELLDRFEDFLNKLENGISENDENHLSRKRELLEKLTEGMSDEEVEQRLTGPYEKDKNIKAEDDEKKPNENMQRAFVERDLLRNR